MAHRDGALRCRILVAVGAWRTANKPRRQRPLAAAGASGGDS